MRRLWLPDYEKKLIAELQKQQNSAQCCDVLLQSEGISIPAHSSVLCGLSLPLSQRLSASPAPPTGEKRRLQLHSVKPQTLIKLVSLFYSGELEVNGAVEQQDVLAAAHSFGFPYLVDEEKFEVKSSQEVCKEKENWRVKKKDMQTQVMPRSFYVSTGTQTITEDTNWTTESSQHLKTATTSSLLACCSVSEKNKFETLSSTTCLANSSECSDGESTHEQSDCMTSTTSSLLCSSEKITLQLSSSDTSNCSRLQEGEVQTDLPATSSQVETSCPIMEEDGQRKHFESSERTNQENMERGFVVEGRQGEANKNLEKMQDMMEATQISIKVKLRRRRSKEEMWEVVNNMQDTGALSGVTSLTLDNYKRPQGNLATVQPSPATEVVCQTSVPQPIISSPKQGPNTSSCSSEPIRFSDGDHTPIPLLVPRPLEETDEQIDKLLEDIMIGLNILPNVEKGNSKSQNQDLSQDGGSCQVQKDKASYCVCSREKRNQNGNSSTNKAVHKPGCTVHPSVELCGANTSLVSTQENSSASSDRADGPEISQSPQTSSCLSDSRDSNLPEEPNVLALLPLATENEVNLFSVADLHFLPCLSPIDSNNNATSGTNTLAQSSLPGTPWLMDNSHSLEFSLNTIDQNQKHSPPEPSTTDCVKEEASSSQSDAAPRLELKAERNLANDVATQNLKKCPNLRLNKTCRNLSTDATINISHCLVSLSSNNVLAEKRKQFTGTGSNNASETDAQTNKTRNLRSKATVRRETLARTPIRTRRKSQQSSSTLISSTPDPNECKVDRKRGRSRKGRVDVKESEPQNENPSLEQTKDVKCNTRKRTIKKDLEESPSKQVSTTDHDKLDDNDNIPPAEKRPRLVSLREFQELIKRQHSKTRRIKDKCEQEQSVNAVDATMELGHSQSDEVNVTQDGAEKNWSAQLLNQSTNPQKTPPQADHKDTSSSFENNDLSEVSDQSEFCICVIADQVTKVSEETEERQKSSPQLFDDGVPDSASENEVTIDDEDSLPLAANTNQENTSGDRSPNSPKSKNGSEGVTGEPKPTGNSAGCPQDDEEEVDVLLHSSPDRASVATEGHKLVEISPDEEEGEDSYDVDVTGSETDA